MPRRTTPLLAGEYYHLYNRGHNRQPIFFERENYLFFLRRVREYLRGESQTSEVWGEPEVRPTSEVWTSIVAYCLMPNHFHLLVCPHDDQLSRRLQRFSISYTKAMNNRYERTGALFQGQFQAVHVDRNDYLLHLSRYIHLNPVAAGLVARPEDWEFSSYREYVNLRRGTLPDPAIVLSQFPTPAAYRAFVESYKAGDEEIIAHLLL
ncbi:MAG TPA: transposase, partial [Chloroflexi bacterium]|nr:transposase [Chloroflexota bacterium]